MNAYAIPLGRMQSRGVIYYYDLTFYYEKGRMPEKGFHMNGGRVGIMQFRGYAGSIEGIMTQIKNPSKWGGAEIAYNNIQSYETT
jgi:hypothetical protein